MLNPNTLLALPILQANAAGAIQSICFQPKGRKHVRENDGLQVRGEKSLTGYRAHCSIITFDPSHALRIFSPCCCASDP